MASRDRVRLIRRSRDRSPRGRPDNSPAVGGKAVKPAAKFILSDE